MKRRSILTALMSTLLTPLPAAAQSLDGVFQIKMRPGWRQADGSHMAGLQIDLAPGWKTYWRQPGDVGIPPQFNWAGSRNLESVQILWPAPKVTWDYGSRSVGYDTQVIFPIVVNPKSAKAVQMQAQILLGVCEEICIPVEVNIHATLPAQGQKDRAIAKAVSNQARVANHPVACSFAIENGATVAQLSIQMPKLGQGEEVAIELPYPTVWIGTPKADRKGGVLKARVEMLSQKGEPISVARDTLRTTVLADGKAVEIRGCQER